MSEEKYFYGSYNVNLVYENHIQEEYNSDNEFIKLIYDIVKTHDNDLTIDELTKELNDYVNGNTDIISFLNNIVKRYISNQNTIKRLSMAFENSIAETPLDYVVKEYSTVKEYIEHSKNFANRIKEKSAKITEANMVQKDGKEIKEYYTFEEFSTLVEINTVKEFENDNDEIDEIENNGLILPYLYDGYISISNGVTDKETVLEDLTGGLAPNIDEKKQFYKLLINIYLRMVMLI